MYTNSFFFSKRRNAVVFFMAYILGMNDAYDVIVVGAGNAALCAAISAKEKGAAKVLVLEKAPLEERGGNSLFTAGGFRFVHDGLDDLRRDILDDLYAAEVSQIVLPAESKDGDLEDLPRAAEGHTHDTLSD